MPSASSAQPLVSAMQLGQLLKEARKRRKLTQTDIGHRLGLSQNRVSHLEQHPPAPARWRPHLPSGAGGLLPGHRHLSAAQVRERRRTRPRAALQPGEAVVGCGKGPAHADGLADLFWMLRAPDGHAKNFSIQLQAGPAGRFQLTPMYDVMSAYPVIGDGPNQSGARDLTLAMALVGKNRHYRMDTIQRRHFNSTARKLGYGESAEPLLCELIERTPSVIAQVQGELPAGFSQEVADKVLDGLAPAARALEAMPEA